MSEPTPYWPPPPTAPIGPDLTPTHTELQTLRTFHAQHEIDVLLDATFTKARFRPCTACGAMIGAQETQGVCYPCSQGNRARGPIYGASLAGHPPVPGDALRAVEAVWVTPDACAECARRNERIDALLEQNDALGTENSDLARQVVALRAENARLYRETSALRGHTEQLATQVRAGKAGA